MLPDFTKIIDVFECMSLDNSAYFTFRDDDDSKICVQFEKISSRNNWKIWYEEKESSSTKLISSYDLRENLLLFNINEDEFLTEISSVLLTQVAFADEFIRQVTELYGQDAIQKSIYDTQTFMEELGQSVEKILNSQENQNKGTKSKIKKSNLRIVK